MLRAADRQNAYDNVDSLLPFKLFTTAGQPECVYSYCGRKPEPEAHTLRVSSVPDSCSGGLSVRTDHRHEGECLHARDSSDGPNASVH